MREKKRNSDVEKNSENFELRKYKNNDKEE